MRPGSLDSHLGTLAVVREADLCLPVTHYYLLLRYWASVPGSREGVHLCLRLLEACCPQPASINRATQAVLTCRSHLVKGTIYYGTHYYSAPVQKRKAAPILFWAGR